MDEVSLVGSGGDTHSTPATTVRSPGPGSFGPVTSYESHSGDQIFPIA